MAFGLGPSGQDCILHHDCMHMRTAIRASQGVCSAMEVPMNHTGCKGFDGIKWLHLPLFG